MATFLAHETIWPSLFEQVPVVCLPLGETRIKFDFRSLEILGNSEIYHYGLLSHGYEATIARRCDRYGQNSNSLELYREPVILILNPKLAIILSP